MKMSVEFLYVSLPGRKISVRLPDGERYILDSEMHEAAEELERYRLELNATGNKENIHKQHVLDAFEKVTGRYYVMSPTPASALEETGRNMSDVYVYRYSDDGYQFLLDYPTYRSIMSHAPFAMNHD